MVAPRVWVVCSWVSGNGGNDDGGRGAAGSSAGEVVVDSDWHECDNMCGDIRGKCVAKCGLSQRRGRESRPNSLSCGASYGGLVACRVRVILETGMGSSYLVIAHGTGSGYGWFANLPQILNMTDWMGRGLHHWSRRPSCSLGRYGRSGNRHPVTAGCPLRFCRR